MSIGVMLFFREELAKLELRYKEEVNDLKDAERVYQKQDDKPHRLTAASCMPETEAFPYQRPKDKPDKKRYERCKHCRNPKRRVDKMFCPTPLLCIHTISILFYLDRSLKRHTIA